MVNLHRVEDALIALENAIPIFKKESPNSPLYRINMRLIKAIWDDIRDNEEMDKKEIYGDFQQDLAMKYGSVIVRYDYPDDFQFDPIDKKSLVNQMENI